MRVEYSSDNSGGRWWLSDDDWKALEAAGWKVVWGQAYFCRGGCHIFGGKPSGKPEPCGENHECPGHRKAESAEEAEQYRWLGALATDAFKEFATMHEAIEEFERITGQDASDDGCDCCGPPHSFSSNAGEELIYLSGSEIAEHQTGVSGMSYRQALELIRQRDDGGER